MDGIILIFRENLRVTIGHSLAPVFLDGQGRFASIGTGEFNGYYNLLRVDEKSIIGLHYYPFDPHVGRALADFGYVSSHFAKSGDCELIIYFDGEREEASDLTIRQEWGKNFIYQSEKGTLAVSFGIPLDDYQI